VIGEITPVCEGQFVQLCRTVFLGKASPILEEKYRILVRALEESLKQIRTGAPASLITTVMNRVIAKQVMAGIATSLYEGPGTVRCRIDCPGRKLQNR